MREYRNLWNKILEILYPTVCPFCGQLSKDGMCEGCRTKVVYVIEPLCKKCGKPIRNEQKEYCYDCDSHRHIFTEGRSLYVHKSPVPEAVYALKYQNRKIYASFFARELAEHYGSYLMRKRIDLILPIPLHKRKLRQRGFNQAELVAKELGRLTGITVDTGILKRIKDTGPQKSLNDKERMHNIKGAFSVQEKIGRGKNILLIDDIYTTGSTMDEAARVLFRAGAENVCFLTISIGQGY